MQPFGRSYRVRGGGLLWGCVLGLFRTGEFLKRNITHVSTASGLYRTYFLYTGSSFQSIILHEINHTSLLQSGDN